MTYRLPGGRVPLTIETGAYAGLSVTVEPIGSWVVYRLVVGRAAAFFAADGPAAELRALSELYAAVIAEAQPAWDIEDHRGQIPPTLNGMLRLPLPLGLQLFDLWTDTFVSIAEEEAEPRSAVDELIPPGPMRDAMNAQLRVVA